MWQAWPNPRRLFSRFAFPLGFGAFFRCLRCLAEDTKDELTRLYANFEDALHSVLRQSLSRGPAYPLCVYHAYRLSDFGARPGCLLPFSEHHKTLRIVLAVIN